MFLTISELTRKNGISKPAVYHWLECGAIDKAFVDRSTGIIRIEEDHVLQLVRDGVLMRRPGRKHAGEEMPSAIAIDAVGDLLSILRLRKELHV
jgi:hypothetical protein